MLSPRQKYEVCRVKSGTALFPVIETKLGIIFSGISTRHGNSVITWGDGNIEYYINPKKIDYVSGGNNYITHNYSAAFSGDISINFKQGLKDVYSLSLEILHQTGIQEVKFNIQNFGTFINQFSNLYSLHLQLYAYQQTARMSVIKGDLAQIPNSLKRYKIYRLEVLNSATDYWFNFSTLQGKSLEYLDFDFGAYPAKIIGDLGKLPTSANFIKILSVRSDSAITYTAGKVWASSFDTLSIQFPLSHTELDNLLIDMNNSITTKIGAGIIDLLVFRSSLSDAAVSSLQAKGFTVNINRISDTVLKMPLSANLLDTSSYLNHATMVGTANYTGGALNTSTGNYAYIPNKTSLDFGTGSLYFGCKVKFNAITGVKGIIGKSFAASIVGRYSIYLDSGNILAVTQLTTSVNIINTTPVTPYNDGNWHSIECVCDRTTGQQKLYIDGILINTKTFTPSNNNIAVNGRFTIGAYGNSTASGILASSEFNGAIKDVFVHKF